MRRISSIFIAIIMCVGIVTGMSARANAVVCVHDCGPTATPTQKPTATPTPKPTATPTPKPTVTPTPTLAPCDEHGWWPWSEDEHCVSPTPSMTPTPSVSITPTGTPSVTPTISQTSGGSSWSPTPDGQNSTTNAPGAPSCTVPFPAPILLGGSRIDVTTVEYRWWPSIDPGIDFQAIVFGYGPNQLNMGALPIEKHVGALDITQLHANQHVWASVWAFKGGCAAISQTLEVQ